MSYLDRRYTISTVTGWLTLKSARAARSPYPHMSAEVYDQLACCRVAVYRTEDLRGPVMLRHAKAVRLARAEAARLNAAWQRVAVGEEVQDSREEVAA